MTDHDSAHATAAPIPPHIADMLADTPHGLSDVVYYDLVQLAEAIRTVHALIDGALAGRSGLTVRDLLPVLHVLAEHADSVVQDVVPLWSLAAHGPVDPFPALHPREDAAEDAA